MPTAPDLDMMMSRKFRLTDCTVVAITKGWATQAETGIDLQLSEGRSSSWFPNDNSCTEGRSTFDYVLEFFLSDGEESDISEHAPARIVIGGKRQDGAEIKVFGKGWIGRDNLGQLEGRFERPPRMILAPLNESVHGRPKRW